MPDIQRAQPMNFKDRFSHAVQDKHVTKQESKALKAHIHHMQIPEEDKAALNKVVNQLEDATNNSFFGFKWKSGINAKEAEGLQELAKTNRMANQLMRFYNEATTQQATLNQNLIQGRSQHHMDPQGVDFNPEPNNTPSASPPPAAPTPSAVSFPDAAPQPESAAPVRPTGPVDNTPMGDMEAELFQAIMNYPGNKATEAEAREIARTLNEAAQAMGFTAENTRKMLAVFAHESGGFDPDARSHTGAGGLGQLTGIAIEDMDQLSREGGPYAQFRDNFVRPGGDRTDIRTNIWTSVAYMDRLMNQIDSDDVSNAFVAYNTGVGGYRALMTMGDGADAYLASATGVANKGAEARAYAGHVEAAYDRMFA